MTLDAWLRQEHSLAERLRLVERLCQAVNEVHDRGDVLSALEPARIEVVPDGRCDLAAARRGSLRAAYRAPEQATDAPSSSEANVYTAGAIAWEILAGRPCGRSPAHLAHVRPELPKELADAVMGCLESSPEWRPRDLTYLVQLVAARQASTRPATEPDQRAARPRQPGATEARKPAARASRSHRPLFLAAALVLAAAAGSYTWFERRARPGASAGAAAPTPAPQSAPRSAPQATEVPKALPTSAPRAGLPPLPSVSEPAVGPAPTREGPVAPRGTAAPEAVAPLELGLTPTPTPTSVPTPTLSGVAPAQVTAVPSTAQPGLSPGPTPAPAPAGPAVLSTLSPLTAQRGGRVLFDLRGMGLHAALRARVLPMREDSRGIVVVRQKWVDPTLVSVLVELDAGVKPGAYGITLEDSRGRQAKPLTFTVTR